MRGAQAPIGSLARLALVQWTFTAWHSDNEGANWSELERAGDLTVPRGCVRLTDVTGKQLRVWRQAKGWDVPRMARELRKIAKDSGEDVAAHHGLVKMIPQWERGNRVPRERYQLLYRKIFGSALGDLSQEMAFSTDFVLRLAEVRARAARLPGPDEIRAVEAAALAKPSEATTPAEIRALAAQAIAHLYEVADKLTELSALLGNDEPGEDKP